MLTIPFADLEGKQITIVCKTCKSKISQDCILSNKIGSGIHLLRYWCDNEDCSEYLELYDVNKDDVVLEEL